MLPKLAKRAVTFPKLVISGCFSTFGMEAKARQCAGSKPNVSFMAKHFPAELVEQEITRLLKNHPFFQGAKVIVS